MACELHAPIGAHSGYADTYAQFVPKASMQGVKVLGEETSDLLQAINLELLWLLLNHFPGGGDQEPVSLLTASFPSGTVHHYAAIH